MNAALVEEEEVADRVGCCCAHRAVSLETRHTPSSCQRGSVLVTGTLGTEMGQLYTIHVFETITQ